MQQVAGAICSLYLVERMGRKFLLMASGLGVGLSMTALATFFYMDDHAEVICPYEEYVIFRHMCTVHNCNLSNFSSLTSTTTSSTICVEQDGFSADTMDKITWLPVLSLVVFKFTFALGQVNINNFCLRSTPNM